MNKFQWNINHNSYILIQENPFENVVHEMANILSQPQCVKSSYIEELISIIDTVPRSYEIPYLSYAASLYGHIISAISAVVGVTFIEVGDWQLSY